jgi:hypothetical protein
MIKDREYIVYSGEAFTVEWYHDREGKSQPRDFYEELDQNRKIQLLKLARIMGDTGRIRNKTKFRNEGDKIYAFKPKPDRFLCFFMEGKKIIITNGFTKKKDKLPPEEKERALNHMKDYKKRAEKGDYYDEQETDEHI